MWPATGSGEMNAEAGNAWFRVAVFIVLVGGALALFTEPGSAEFVMSVASLVLGLIFIATIAFLVRRGSR